MTEAEWNICTNPWKLLGAFKGKASDRKLRLLACSCVRRIWGPLTDGRVRAAVEMVERYADGHASDEEFARLDDPASIRRGGVYVPHLGLKDAHQAACGTSVWVANVVSGRSKPQGYDDPRWLGERAAHADLARDLFGPLLFRQVRLDPAWLTWNGGAVRKLAEAAYAGRSLPAGTLNTHRLAGLADALEEAGCDRANLLAHLRGPGPHVRGCWAVDLLLGKG
jgi:hypothetical protein